MTAPQSSASANYLSSLFGLNGLTSVVIGGTGVLGGAIAQALGGAGAHVVVWPVLFALGFCAIGWNTVYVTVAAESVEPSSVGRATGQALFFSYAGALSFPPLLGVILDGTSFWTVTWLTAAAIAGTALVVCHALASARQR